MSNKEQHELGDIYKIWNRDHDELTAKPEEEKQQQPKIGLFKAGLLRILIGNKRAPEKP